MRIKLSPTLKPFVDRQNKLKRNVQYKGLITKLLSLGGNVVIIPSSGDKQADFIYARGRTFRSTVTVKSMQSLSAKNDCISMFRRHPDRYVVCIGYVLDENPDFSFWSRSFWLYDVLKKSILDVTGAKKEKYFGVKLTASGVDKIA